MTVTTEEIDSQPRLWQRAAQLAHEVSDLLPAAGQEVCIVGCGTSLYMAQAAASLRERAGLGRTDAYPASELPDSRHYDVLVAISRSGATSEVVHALGRRRATRSVAITAISDGAVAAAADDVVTLPFADERSVMQTRFATTALTLLRTHAGEDPTRAVADAEQAIVGSLPVEPSAVHQWTFLGRGWTIGLAREAALKLREAAQAWTEAYPAFEYRHGPISVSGPGTVVWSFGPIDPALTNEILAIGATVVDLPIDPLASLVVAQRAAVALAESRGLNPDGPRNLARAVTLASSAVSAST
jgi:fructoselysine-6-P-deglycase FrlB-like protein